MQIQAIIMSFSNYSWRQRHAQWRHILISVSILLLLNKFHAGLIIQGDKIFTY